MDLVDIRKQIDEVDEQLVKLFCERMRLAALAATAKWRQGLPLYDNLREEEISERIAKLAGQEFSHYARRFFNTLFSISKDYQIQWAGTDKWPDNAINDQ